MFTYLPGKVQKHGYVYAVLAVLFISQACLAQALQARSLHYVSKVIDGDTLILSSGQHVRLLGINAPELTRKNRQGEAGGYDAYIWLEKQVEKKSVALEFDQQHQDKYGRQLAHVFSVDGKHVNLDMVRYGHAIASVIPPNVKYTRALLTAQQAAERQQLGLWKEPSYAPVGLLKAQADRQSGWKRMVATVSAVINDRGKDKNFARLIIHDNADIRIPRANLGYFPELGTYLGQKLEIRGWLSKRRGHYSVLIRHPSAMVRLANY
jgi:endonuclease YncB( thermonuclease family)